MSGASAYGTYVFGGPDQQLQQLNTQGAAMGGSTLIAMTPPSAGWQPGCTTGGARKMRKGRKMSKKMGGDGIVLPIAFIAANQMYKPKNASVSFRNNNRTRSTHSNRKMNSRRVRSSSSKRRTNRSRR